MKNEFAEIVFPLPLDHAFTYRVPVELRETLQVGHRVLASFGRRRLTGFVANITNKTSLKELKEIDDVLDPQPLFSDELLTLCRWIADYYICSPGEVLKAALPAGMHRESKLKVQLAVPYDAESAAALEDKSPRQAQLLKALGKTSPQTYDQLKRKVGSAGLKFALSALESKGFIKLEEVVPGARVKPRTESYLRLSAALTPEQLRDQHEILAKRALKQAACLHLLMENPDKWYRLPDLVSQNGISSQSLKALVRLGVVEFQKREVWRDYYSQVEAVEPPPLLLTGEQQGALAAITQGIDGNTFRTFLLHGITGSGKTQVYIEAIRHALDQGKGAIVMVPEISLTPQIVARFRSYFRNLVAVLHSRMSGGERYDSWRRIKQGEQRIVVGPRSVAFAPVNNLGLVVIDEEQESTLKQMDMNPRYHGRDVAVMRAKVNNAVAVLGSATPSFESYHNARRSKYFLLNLTHRIDHIPLPEVTLVDMAAERKARGFREQYVFSRLLHEKIAEKLSLNEQIILLQNRRGYSTFIKCKDCGHIEGCRNCNVTLTYHAFDQRLRCHYCEYTKKAPNVCPVCGGVDILFRGVGTQKVEGEVLRLFPDARLVRMDLDTTRGKRSHDRILKAFQDGTFNILLGTQMVAKGLDFQRVSLVGVISADTGLFFPDFRAAEQTFQLITQVAGRAGRVSKRGEVVVQTYSPDHYCLQFAKNHDFLGFYMKEIEDRRLLRYPPYGRLVVLCFRSPSEQKASRAATVFKSLLPSHVHPFQSFGPLRAPLSKIQRNYRWQIIIKESKEGDPGGRQLNQVLRGALERFRKAYRDRTVRLTIDIDPVWML